MKIRLNFKTPDVVDYALEEIYTQQGVIDDAEKKAENGLNMENV